MTVHVTGEVIMSEWKMTDCHTLLLNIWT